MDDSPKDWIEGGNAAMNLIIGIAVTTVVLVAVISAVISHLEERKSNPKSKEQRRQERKELLTGSFQGALIITCGIGAVLFLLAFVVISGLASVFPYDQKNSRHHTATCAAATSPSPQPGIDEILATPTPTDYAAMFENSEIDAMIREMEEQQEQSRKQEAAQAQREKRWFAIMQQRREAAAALVSTPPSPEISPSAPGVTPVIPEIDGCGIWVTVYDSCDNYHHVGNEWSIRHYASFDLSLIHI